MVRVRLLCIALVVLLWTGAPICARCSEGDVQMGAFLSARDATGHIWGGVNDVLNPLLRWQDGRWQAVPIKAIEIAEIQAMTRASDGAVLCVWDKNGTHWVTRHLGGSSLVLAQFTGGGHITQLLPDSRGGAWMLGDENVIRRVTSDGGVQTSLTLAPGQYYPPSHSHRNDDGYESLNAATDGQKRVWVWADYAAGDIYQACLRGVLIWDGHAWIHHPTLAGVPDKPFNMIVPRDATHLWVAVAESGLYLVDTTTLRGTLVNPPLSGAFRWIERIFRDGQDWYVLDWVDTYSAVRWVNAWRLRQGRWQEVIHGIDKGAEYDDQPRRAWLGTPQGVWLSAFDGGAYWIPHGDTPAWPVDWRADFPLTNVKAFFPLSQGRLLVVGGGGSVVLPSVPSPPAYPAPVRTVPVDSDCRELVPDEQRHLWGFPLLNHPSCLGEWDGHQWLFHLMPTATRHQSAGEITTDNLHRVWLWSSDQTGRVAVFRHTSQTWNVYPSFQAAIQAQKGIPNLRLSGRAGPCFRADGQYAAYRTPSGLIVAYDGQAWHRWTPLEITKKDGEYLQKPFFDQSGNLCVSLTNSNTSWRWTDGQEWQKADDIPSPDGPQRYPSLEAELHALVPSTGPMAYVARDDQGALWSAQDRRLYKEIFGLSAPRFVGLPRQPFIDGRSVDGVTHDCANGTWLLTSNAASAEYVYLPPVPAPETAIRLQRGQLGSVSLRFPAQRQGKFLYAWRLDGGPWSGPQPAAGVHLDFLPNGPHHVEVLALDSGLDTPLAPDHLAFVIHVDPVQQMATLIGILLHGSDEDRERVMAALRRQPDRDLSALRAARATADDDSRWWIDAAIQQAEEGTPPSAGQIPSP